MRGVPSIFLSAWLPQQGTIGAESLLLCDSILVLEEPGIFSAPSGASSVLIHTGPIRRAVKFTAQDRAALRRKNDMSPDTFFLVVVPGGGTSESETPILNLVLSAFDSISAEKKKLAWVSTKDFSVIHEEFLGSTVFNAIKYFDPIEELIAMADIVITKGSRGISHDAQSVGVPSISISFGKNPVDDLLVPRIRNNVSLYARATTPDILKKYILESSRSDKPSPPPSSVPHIANILLSEITRLLKKSRPV